ncbi:ABC transporter permease [Agromyces sp. G08B096]|uniref:ABC transporter permease n=1 Tax=Agromyces sp. G08B096 TaxID=3156399 RepID=A0AAU7W4I2_9MICO
MSRLLHGELVRLAATRLPVWTAVVAVAAGASITGLLALVGPEHATPPMPGIDTADGVALVLGINAMLLFLPALIGTVAVTSEYRHRTIGTTFLVAPRRARVLVAKLGVYSLVGLAYGAVTAASAGLALAGAAAVRGVPLGVTPAELGALLVRLALAAAVYTAIGVAIGALARHQLVAIGIVLGVFYFLEPLLMLVPGVNAVYAVLPGGATAALLASTFLGEAVAAEVPMLLAPQHLSAAGGALLLLAYAAAAAVAAVAVPLRRDLR